MGKLIEVDGQSAGDWIAPALDGWSGPLVKEQLPQGFSRYLRLFHPAVDANGRKVAWAQVCNQMGSTFHRLVQWDCLTQSQSQQWNGSRPIMGELSPEILDPLCLVLARHSHTASNCYFGLSTIHGRSRKRSVGKRPLRFGEIRSFRVFVGPLSAAAELGVDDQERADRRPVQRSKLVISNTDVIGQTGHTDVPLAEDALPQLRYLEGANGESPNLIWPEDRQWFVATDVDFDSTLIGGSVDLIEELIARTDLECQVVNPWDSLAADADEINCVSGGVVGFQGGVF